MLADVDNEFSRPPTERLEKEASRRKTTRKSKRTKLRTIDESKPDDWLDRARQSLHCSVFCGGSKCKCENWEAMKDEEKRAAAIEGLNSNWVGDLVIASQRPSTSLFLKYPIITQFREKQVTGVLNLQEKGEHGSCGPDGIYESSGYSYNGAEDLMPHGVAYYEFPWPDMTAPQQDIVLRSVQVMDYHVKKKGKVLVHCHAGLGRTGLMIACYYVYSRHIPSAEAVALVRRNRPGAIQTSHQSQFIKDFERHIWRLAQAFRVEISDALMDVDIFMQRQRLVLHGEQADLYRNVPMFLHVILCRLLNLTRNDVAASRLALESLGPSAAPSEATLSACRIAINRRRFRVQNVYDVSLLSFLVCDWFRSMSSPALPLESCNQIVEFKRTSFSAKEGLRQVIRQILPKPARHTLGMVICAFSAIAQQVEGVSLANFAFRCIVDSFNHAFNPIKLRHSPMERELIHEFFLDWAESIGEMYFNYDVVPAAHRTIRRIALASSIVLDATVVNGAGARPRRSLAPPSPTSAGKNMPRALVASEVFPARNEEFPDTGDIYGAIDLRDSEEKTRAWRRRLSDFRKASPKASARQKGNTK